jgi:hypothetical protein
MSETFDANRRLAEIALWVDGSARWVDWATEAARTAAPRRRQVTITFDRTKLETFATGLRCRPRADGLGSAGVVPPR